MTFFKKVLRFLWIVYATIIGYLTAVFVTIGFCSIGIFLLLLRLKKAVWYLQRVWGFIMFAAIGKRVNIIGKENIEKNKHYLMISNHGSSFDIPALSLIKPEMTAWVAKSSLFRIPIFGFILKLGIAIPIDRKNIKSAAEAINKTSSTENRRSICIFPEGARSIDGKLQDFKRGFARILKISGLNLLPVTLNGFYTLLSSNRHFYMDPVSKLEIIIHKPIPNGKLVDLTDKEIIEIAKKAIEKDFNNN